MVGWRTICSRELSIFNRPKTLKSEERGLNLRNSGQLPPLKAKGNQRLNQPLRRAHTRKERHVMAYKIEVREGAYVVIDLSTGGRAKGSSDYQQKHFAEEFIRKANEADVPVERARDDKGRLKGDDPSTPEVNEAYVGGKAPKKRKKAPAKKKASKKKVTKKK